MNYDIHVINAFTQQDFAGNPAAVVPLNAFLPTQTMQQIAAQNNLSETAFVVPSDNAIAIRWFSPHAEIPFCGHATLASAFVLFEAEPARDNLRFNAHAVGEFTVTKSSDGQLHMVFPQRQMHPVTDIPAPIHDCLSVLPDALYRDDQAYYAVYSDAEVIHTICCDTSLARGWDYDICVTAASDKYDFISRYFMATEDGREDPVTGSIHTTLAPFWSQKLAKDTLIAYQASQRGGILGCQLRDNNAIISGFAKRYLTGVINISTTNQ